MEKNKTIGHQSDIAILCKLCYRSILIPSLPMKWPTATARNEIKAKAKAKKEMT